MKALFAVVLFAALDGVAAAQPYGTPLQRCMVAAQLKAVYTRPSLSKDLNRFVVVSVRGRPQAYVQCMFANSEKLLYCEASSLYYAEDANKPRALYLPADRIKALGKLGFATGPSERNFRYERPIDSTADFDAMAAFMLTALHKGYGVRKGEQIEMKSPVVAKDSLAACR